MKILVLGAGIIGVSTAWFLRKYGHDVTVIDRQPSASLETSFANGCQISVSHSEPWANPSAPLKVFKWLFQDDAPLLFRPHLDMNQLKWCMQFLKECTQEKTDYNIRQIVSLAEYSRKTFKEIRDETNIQYDCLTKGILHFYTNEKEFNDSIHAASLMRSLGCPRNSISKEEVLKIEPALKNIASSIVGGDYTDNDESGDVYKFTGNLAKLCEKKGVNFLYDTKIVKICINDNQATGVEVLSKNGYKTINADKVVVCLGSYSKPLLDVIGINLIMYPGKGYSATYKILDLDNAPFASITDDEHKLVYTRLGDRMRVAGTCELDGYSHTLNDIRCKALTKRMKEVFPGLCDYDNPIYWTGLRPLTPSNIPYVGKTKFKNLYLNTGHGTLGWTMGPGSGKALSLLIDEKEVQIKFNFLK